MGRSHRPARLSIAFVIPLVFLAALAGPPAAELQDPAWLADLSSIPLHTPPFEVPVTTETLVRMEVEPGMAYRITGGRARAYRLLEGEIEDIANGPPGGWAYLYYSHIENDQMVFKPRQEGTLKVESGPMREEPLEAGEQLEVTVTPEVETVGRFVNLDPGESICIYEFYMGEEVPMEVPEEYRTITFHGSGDWSQKNWKAAADRLVVRVTKGRVQVKAGQPFPR